MEVSLAFFSVARIMQTPVKSTKVVNILYPPINVSL